MSYPMFVPNFKTLDTVVPEKSLMKKKKKKKKDNKITHRQTWIWKAENYIPPIYCVCRGIYLAN